MAPSKTVSAGYTLIEVLVAFMILALALTVLLRIFSGGLRSVSLSSQYARAILVAEAQLAAADTPDGLVPGTTTGTDGEAFQWTRRVTDYPPGSERAGGSPRVPAYQIDVDVEWQQAGKTRSVSLSGLRLTYPEANRP